MSTLQEMLALSPNGELDELSLRALKLYRETLAAELEPGQDGKGLAIHPDSGDDLVASTPTHAGHAMHKQHPEGGFVTMRIGRKPDYSLSARINRAAKTRATVEDLYRVPENGKAELVNGELVLMPATGARPGKAGFKITLSLYNFTHMIRHSHAVPDNVGFLVNLPNRESFSPDSAYFIGPDPGMKFFQGAPRFAAEVRSENDYGPAMECAIAEKIADYFAAGTLVVWDVDLLSTDVIRVYRADDPLTPTVYRRGEIAEAEPAVPGWTMPVNDLFPLGDDDNS